MLSSSGAGNVGALRSLADAVTAGRGAAFKVVYTSTSKRSSSGPQTITIEQKPPKSLFKTGDSSAISDGTAT